MLEQIIPKGKHESVKRACINLQCLQWNRERCVRATAKVYEKLTGLQTEAFASAFGKDPNIAHDEPPAQLGSKSPSAETDASSQRYAPLDILSKNSDNLETSADRRSYEGIIRPGPVGSRQFLHVMNVLPSWCALHSWHVFDHFSHNAGSESG